MAIDSFPEKVAAATYIYYIAAAERGFRWAEFLINEKGSDVTRKLSFIHTPHRDACAWMEGGGEWKKRMESAAMKNDRYFH